MSCCRVGTTGSPVIRLADDIDPNAALLRPLLTRHRVATMFEERRPAHGLLRSLHLFFVRLYTHTPTQRTEGLERSTGEAGAAAGHFFHSPPTLPTLFCHPDVRLHTQPEQRKHCFVTGDIKVLAITGHENRNGACDQDCG